MQGSACGPLNVLSLCACFDGLGKHFFKSCLEDADAEFAGRASPELPASIEKIIDRHPAMLVKKCVLELVLVVDGADIVDAMLGDRRLDVLDVGIGLIPRHMNGNAFEAAVFIPCL